MNLCNGTFTQCEAPHNPQFPKYNYGSQKAACEHVKNDVDIH